MPKRGFPKVNLLLTAFFLSAILWQTACQSDRGKAGKTTQTKEAENEPNLKSILQTLKPQETPELLLLGLYYGGEDSATIANEFPNGYRTLLLRYENGKVQLVENLPYLATPQAT